MSADKEASIHIVCVVIKTAGVRKTFALFILPGQPNQALNQDTGWRRGVGDEKGGRGGAGGRVVLLELDFLLIKSRV